MQQIPLGDGIKGVSGSVPKVVIVDHPGDPCFQTFRIRDEDEIFGNLITRQLVRDGRVIFAAAKCPHPLQAEIHLDIRTEPTAVTPSQALVDAIGVIQGNLKAFEEGFRRQVATDEL